MANVLLQLSSFLRVSPITSHNLLEQLLNLEEKYTVHYVHCHWDFKKCFYPSQPCLVKKNKGFQIKKIKKIGHGGSNFLRKTI